MTNGFSVRAAARHFGASPTTVTRRIMVLCRQSIALHSALTAQLLPREDLVADGFQSFWVSQYHPNNFNLLVGADSQYVYAMTPVTLRRSGRMTPTQLAKRARVDIEDPSDSGALLRSFRELLNNAEELWNRMPMKDRVLRTDEHTVYPRCLETCGVKAVQHVTVSSRMPRTVDNPIFSANYLDREIRKDLAEHHRETVCFARNAALSTARMWIYLVAHNTEKEFRISPRVDHSHVEAAGLPSASLIGLKSTFFSRRAFFGRSSLNHTLRKAWFGLIHTPESSDIMSFRLNPGYA